MKNSVYKLLIDTIHYKANHLFYYDSISFFDAKNCLANLTDIDKKMMEIVDIDYEPIFQVFGSKTSTDWDIMVFVNDIPPNQFDATTLCKAYNILLKHKYEQFMDEKPMNCNLAILGNNTLKQVYKGTIDESNNAILHTCDNFHQYCENFITLRIERNIEIKVLRTARVLLSFLSRTSHRIEIKKALRGTIYHQLEMLKKIDFNTIQELGNSNVNFNDYVKTIAFQLGQTCSLMIGTELYTKEEIANYYPVMKPHLFREDNCDLTILESKKLDFIDLCKKIEFKNEREYDYKKL